MYIHQTPGCHRNNKQTMAKVMMSVRMMMMWWCMYVMTARLVCDEMSFLKTQTCTSDVSWDMCMMHVYSQVCQTQRNAGVAYRRCCCDDDMGCMSCQHKASFWWKRQLWRLIVVPTHGLGHVWCTYIVKFGSIKEVPWDILSETVKRCVVRSQESICLSEILHHLSPKSSMCFCYWLISHSSQCQGYG